jgi:ABC-2 type transport system ATP-binding protein
LLRNLRRQGLTILLTTHYLEEAEALCSRIGMIDRGALGRTGAPKEIIGEAGNFVLEYFRNGETAQSFFKSRPEALAAAADLNDEFTVREANLEDAFIKLTKNGWGHDGAVHFHPLERMDTVQAEDS